MRRAVRFGRVLGIERPFMTKLAEHVIGRMADRYPEQWVLFAAHGYREVRRFYEMAIELDGLPPAPVLPDGLTIEAFDEALRTINWVT